MYTTLGAPSGAFGGSNGAPSGFESRMSTLMTPWNRLLIADPPDRKLGSRAGDRAPVARASRQALPKTSPLRDEHAAAAERAARPRERGRTQPSATPSGEPAGFGSGRRLMRRALRRPRRLARTGTSSA